MKKLIGILGIFGLAALMIFTAVDAKTPFPPWVKELTAELLPTGAGNQQGHFIKKQARFITLLASNTCQTKLGSGSLYW